MKTKLLSLLAAVLLTQATMAQFHLGAKAGANITKIDGKAFKDEFRYGYHLGGFMEIRMGNKLVLQPEVLFNQFSTSVDSNFNNVYHNAFNSQQSDRKLNYLSVHPDHSDLKLHAAEHGELPIAESCASVLQQVLVLVHQHAKLRAGLQGEKTADQLIVQQDGNGEIIQLAVTLL